MTIDNRKVSELVVDDLKTIIKEVTNALLSELRTEVTTLTTEVAELREENKQMCKQMEAIKLESEVRFKEIVRMEDQIKRKNIIIKGLPSSSLPKESVQNLCLTTLNIIPQNINIRSVKKMFDRNNKMGVIAELNSEEEVYEILRNTKKLSGSQISIEKDLNSVKQEQKKVMLQLKKDIFQEEKSQRLTVRDERLRIGDKWFYWNQNKELTCGSLNGITTMEQIYGKSLTNIDFKYSNLLAKVNFNSNNQRF